MTSPLHPVWRDYRTRRRVLVAVIVGLVPVLTRAGTALRGLTGGDAAHHLLASAWITGAVAAAWWFAAFRCPFCRNPFHWTLWVANPFSGECLHCGFRKWRDPHAARALTQR
jgi:Zn ribbon nucleic-acid-binding protein